MRGIRSASLSLLTALSLPVAVLFVLPYAEIGFVPSEPDRASSPFAAFVVLTPEQEEKAMRRAKFAGSSDVAGVAVSHADLILSALPDDPPPPIVRLSDRVRPPAPARIGWRPTPYLPTCAAPAPAEIAPEREAPPAADFTREELLKLD